MNEIYRIRKINNWLQCIGNRSMKSQKNMYPIYLKLLYECEILIICAPKTNVNIKNIDDEIIAPIYSLYAGILDM